MSRIYFSAGDASGDMHGANLIRALREAEPSIACEGLGGPRMAEAGMDLHYDLASQGIMGFVEVARRILPIRRLFHETLDHLEATRPHALVVIDFPGFNLRLAERAARLGIPVIYYISPQVWAWKRGRVARIARCVSKMLVILPFEETIYRESGVECTYVGHPLLDHLAATPVSGVYRDDLVIGLLPGSREQEIRRLLPVMLDVARGLRDRYPEARFVAPCLNGEREAQVRQLAGRFPLETRIGGMYELLDGARFCMVASGTATLETALFNTPMAVVYKIAPASYWLAKRLVHVDHISLVNILAGKGIVPEFIQHEACASRVLPAALDLIEDTPARAAMMNALAQVRRTLGEAGASRRAAAEILGVLARRRNG